MNESGPAGGTDAGRPPLRTHDDHLVRAAGTPGPHRGRERVPVGPDAKVIDLLSRLPAPIYQSVPVRGARRRR